MVSVGVFFVVYSSEFHFDMTIEGQECNVVASLMMIK